MPVSKHVPLRTCVVCGKKTAKADLTRIAATPDGPVVVDDSGKMPGRGTYVCRDGECVRGSLSKGRLEFALRRALSDEDWANVIDRVASVEISA